MTLEFHAADLHRQCTRLDAEDDAASSAWANDPGWNLIPDGESPWESCEQCRGVFHSSQIQPTDATATHMHLCPSCTKLRWAAGELRRIALSLVPRDLETAASLSPIVAALEAGQHLPTPKGSA